MKLQSKFSATIIDTNFPRSALITPSNVELDIITFNDGSIRVRIANLDELRLDARIADRLNASCTIVVHATGMDDLMVAAQIRSVLLNELDIGHFNLALTSTLYTRYDRVMLDDKSDAFGARVFAHAVNALGMNTVVLYDAHSDVITGLIKNCVNVHQSSLVYEMRKAGLIPQPQDAAVVCPDAGAAKKLYGQVVTCEKTRDVKTGKLSGFRIASKTAGSIAIAGDYESLLVIDDICEGGGTFMGLQEVLAKDMPVMPIDLYVTHGIFSNNAIPRLLTKYRKIYVYFMKESTYNELSDKCKKQIVVNTLIEGL